MLSKALGKVGGVVKPALVSHLGHISKVFLDDSKIWIGTAYTLTNFFGKYNNQTPLQVINQRILMEAKRLFLFSDKTSQEISYELGFKEAGHFSKFFKKNEGCNPTEFKKKKLVPPFL